MLAACRKKIPFSTAHGLHSKIVGKRFATVASSLQLCPLDDIKGSIGWKEESDHISGGAGGAWVGGSLFSPTRALHSASTTAGGGGGAGKLFASSAHREIITSVRRILLQRPNRYGEFCDTITAVMKALPDEVAELMSDEGIGLKQIADMYPAKFKVRTVQDGPGYEILLANEFAAKITARSSDSSSKDNSGASSSASASVWGLAETDGKKQQQDCPQLSTTTDSGYMPTLTRLPSLAASGEVSDEMQRRSRGAQYYTYVQQAVDRRLSEDQALLNNKGEANPYQRFPLVKLFQSLQDETAAVEAVKSLQLTPQLSTITPLLDAIDSVLFEIKQTRAGAGTTAATAESSSSTPVAKSPQDCYRESKEFQGVLKHLETLLSFSDTKKAPTRLLHVINIYAVPKNWKETLTKGCEKYIEEIKLEAASESHAIKHGLVQPMNSGWHALDNFTSCGAVTATNNIAANLIFSNASRFKNMLRNRLPILEGASVFRALKNLSINPSAFDIYAEVNRSFEYCCDSVMAEVNKDSSSSSSSGGATQPRRNENSIQTWGVRQVATVHQYEQWRIARFLPVDSYCPLAEVFARTEGLLARDMMHILLSAPHYFRFEKEEIKEGQRDSAALLNDSNTHHHGKIPEYTYYTGVQFLLQEVYIPKEVRRGSRVTQQQLNAQIVETTSIIHKISKTSRARIPVRLELMRLKIALIVLQKGLNPLLDFDIAAMAIYDEFRKATGFHAFRCNDNRFGMVLGPRILSLTFAANLRFYYSTAYLPMFSVFQVPGTDTLMLQLRDIQPLIDPASASAAPTGSASSSRNNNGALLYSSEASAAPSDDALILQVSLAIVDFNARSHATAGTRMAGFNKSTYIYEDNPTVGFIKVRVPRFAYEQIHREHQNLVRFAQKYPSHFKVFPGTRGIEHLDGYYIQLVNKKHTIEEAEAATRKLRGLNMTIKCAAYHESALDEESSPRRQQVSGSVKGNYQQGFLRLDTKQPQSKE